AAQVQVYPNPGRGVFTVSHPKAAAAQKLLVYNAYGALVGFKTAAPGSQQTSISLGHLPAGAYYLTFPQGGALSSAQFCISK
ncbi:MAG: T9SS type A sorting domain-containing protein, partial [Chitinophagaceae bacterium]